MDRVPTHHYCCCNGLTRLIVHMTVAKLRSNADSDAVRRKEIFEDCEAEARRRGNPQIEPPLMEEALRHAVDQGWLERRKDQLTVTPDGWYAYGQDRIGNALCPGLSQTSRRPPALAASGSSLAVDCAPSILAALGDALAMSKGANPQAPSVQPAFDPRVNIHGEVTRRELLNMYAWSNGGEEPAVFSVGMQLLALLGHISIASTGPLEGAGLISLTRRGLTAYKTYWTEIDSNARSLNGFYPPDERHVATRVRRAVLSYLANCRIPLAQRIERIPDNETTQAARDHAELVAWPPTGARFDELVRLLVAGSAERYGAHSDDRFQSLLRHLAASLRHSARHEVANIVLGRLASPTPADVVDTIWQQLEEQEVHVSGTHMLPGTSPVIDNVVIEHGPPKDRFAETTPWRKPRMIIYTKRRKIMLDGQEHRVTKRQMEILQVLAQCPGEYVPTDQLKRGGPTSKERPDLIVKKTPKPILDLVQRRPGQGVSLDLSPEEIRIEE